MVGYVVAFVYNSKGELLLIKKNRPNWQVGKLNGVGGHIEPDESIAEAMRREFLEEAGFDLELEHWREYCNLYGDGYEVFFFTNNIPVDEVQQMTDEELVWVDPNNLPDNIIPNLKWLIPLSKECAYASVSERMI